MTDKKPDLTDLNALAMEACDMWQEHLSNFANDPNARAELTRFLEPQRRLFSDWAAMMRGGSPDPNRAKEEPAAQTPNDAAKKPPAEEPAAATPPPAAAPPGGVAHVDDPLRVAQLALRMAELEKRVAQLELRLAGAPR